VGHADGGLYVRGDIVICADCAGAVHDRWAGALLVAGVHGGLPGVDPDLPHRKIPHTGHSPGLGEHATEDETFHTAGHVLLVPEDRLRASM
jgi:hypothetical protein